MSFVFYTSHINLAHGALKSAFGSEVKRRGLCRLLVVTETANSGASNATTSLESLKRVLPEEAEVVVLEISSRVLRGVALRGPTMAGALELIALEQCDAVVALGRQPVIDFAKLLMRDLARADAAGPFHASPLRASPSADATLPCFIAVPSDLDAVRALGPTTLVPGQEDGSIAALFDPKLVPDVAICDEDFLRPSSRLVAAAVGMSILSDGIEVFFARGDNPTADAHALDAVRQVRAYLEDVAEGVPHQRAGDRLAGALVECLGAIRKGMGAARAIGNAVAISHFGGVGSGGVSAVVLPIVLEFNIGRGASVSTGLIEALGLPRQHIAGYVRSLAGRLRLPASLDEFGIGRHEIGYLAQLAHRDANTSTNPCEIAVDDYAAVLASGFL